MSFLWWLSARPTLVKVNYTCKKMKRAISPPCNVLWPDLKASCKTREVDSKTTSSSSLQNGQRIWKASATAKIPRNECPFTQRSATHLDREPAGSLNLPTIFYPGFGQEVRARFLTTLTLFLEFSKTPTYPFSRRWLVRNMNLYGWFYWKYRPAGATGFVRTKTMQKSTRSSGISEGTCTVLKQFQIILILFRTKSC